MRTSDQDFRILVSFGAPADGAALLVEDGAMAVSLPQAANFAVPTTAHAVGCACCLPRGPAALALGRLFLARARGEMPLFDRVIAVTCTGAGAAAVRAALEGDVVTRARFRLAPEASGS